MRLSSNADNFVEKVQDYILRHLDAPHRLSDLGSMVGVSTFHLHRKFREVVGQTPSQQVRRLRLKRASRLLVSAPFGRIDQPAFVNASTKSAG